ncbi:MAG: hypothetical protein IK143_03730 [Bacteroidales bacterium]|nr:hypothetical protein [Bacteroidales bacterium]
MNNIPSSIKLMDSGMARFRCEGDLVDAVNHIMAILSEHGGAVQKTSDNSVTADFNTTWRLSYITATVEPSGDGWATMFKEGNSGTRLFNYLVFAVCAIVMTAAILVIPGLWCIFAVFAIAFAYLYLRFTPSPPCQKRMENIVSEILDLRSRMTC